ncbi:epoxyqueuosine reductase QueG [Methanomicrobium sp. W14]|uniref:epoxyqueuosine reductase n=1 Tax=Methanomicrobium sp. W14 TaxID=2817839 RepID=UPI001AE342DB|nr:epoxyqueuosine reductase [Methanomicrobium sp. W14]MBP2134081.1 epoxyqueuosine reductase QueG [Methanomicrobium sp. W14]
MKPDSDISEGLSDLLTKKDVDIFGYCDLSKVSPLPFPNLKNGISIGISLNPEIVKNLEKGPDDRYVAEYASVNKRLYRSSEIIAEFLKENGYDASFIPPTKQVDDPKVLYAEFPHKTAATASGLGWIGKCALLITKKFGSALRITTVFTNAPLPFAEPVSKSYCGRCTECMDICPAGAVSGKEWSPELYRDEFWNAGLCFEYSRNKGGAAGSEHPVCGLCIAACPWTKKYIKREEII